MNKAFRNALEKDLFNFVHEFIKLGVNPARIYFPGSVFTDGNNRYNDFIEDLYGDKLVVKYKFRRKKKQCLHLLFRRITV